MENCPDCGAHRSGGWTQRTREVIELPVVPVQVTEHVYLARTCPACRRRCTPPAVLDGVVLGQQRRGVNLLSLIATLREEGRLPIRSVQWYLDTVHQFAPQRGSHRERHSPDRAAGPTSGVPRSWTASAPAQWSTPTIPAGARTAPMATCGLSAPPPKRYFLRNATSCGGVGARRWWTKL